MTTDLASDIVVVSGLPRSGTSLMMRMVEAAGIPPVTDGQRVADEDNPMGYYEFEAVKQLKHDQSWLATAGGKAVKVIHLLLMELPPTHRYRLIFMNRHLDEVLASQQKMLQRHGKAGAAISPDLLKKTYQSQLAQVNAWLAARPHFSRLDVDYNALLADAKPQLQAIAAFLGKPASIDAMHGVIRQDLYRNRKA